MHDGEEAIDIADTQEVTLDITDRQDYYGWANPFHARPDIPQSLLKRYYDRTEYG